MLWTLALERWMDKVGQNNIEKASTSWNFPIDMTNEPWAQQHSEDKMAAFVILRQFECISTCGSVRVGVRTPMCKSLRENQQENDVNKNGCWQKVYGHENLL